jgi:DNA-binding SARP family transcriptional activator/DNA-binding beta-propeller fold protein YncE
MAEVWRTVEDKRSTLGGQWRMAIEIRLLGPLEVSIDGRPVELGSPQQRTLLGLLALHAGSAVRPIAIEDVLWEGEPPPSATKVVQTYVSRLRKRLGPDSIRLTRSGYALGANVSVDAHRFRELVELGEVAQALALWRGSALSDLPLLAADARQLDELRVSAVEARIDTELDRGEGPELVPELEELVAKYPLRERLLRQLMLALYRSGRQADALSVYRDGREAFIELGLEPGPAVRELEVQILRHDPALLPPAPAASEPVSRRRRRRRIWIAATVVAAASAALIASAIVASGHAKAAVPIRANTLLELDPTTNQFVHSIPIGRDPAALEATGDALWIASERERTVSRVDLRTRAVKTIGEPHPVAFIAHDDRGNVYVSGWDFPFVWQIDPRTVQIVRRFRVETRALGLAVGGGSLWVVDRLANAVTRIDLAQRRVAETIRVGVNPLASSFGYGALWVANGDSGTVSVFQPGAVKPLEVRDIPSPFAISTGAGGVWVASNGMHAVYRIDPDTHAIVKRIDLGTPYDFLYGVSAGEHGVWAVENHHVVRIDPATDRVVARIPFPPGTEPKAVASTASDVWISVGNPKDDL